MDRSVLFEAQPRALFTDEWRAVWEHMDRLQTGNRDDTITEYPDTALYFALNTLQINNINYVLDRPELLSDLSTHDKVGFAINAYFSHTGPHTMYGRTGVLEAISEQLEENIPQAERTHPVGNKHSWSRRVLASVHEELGEITGDPIHLGRAIELNKAIVEDLNLLWFHPHKIHALFSSHDIDFFYLANGDLDQTEIDTLARNMQAEFYNDLTRVASEMYRANNNDENILSMAGATFEILSLGILRDRLIKLGKAGKVGARQAYLREDYMLPITEPLTNRRLRVPNHSFDLVLYYRDRRESFQNRLNLELKKGANKNGPRLLPGIICKKGNYNDMPISAFAERILHFSQGRINYYTGHNLSDEQRKARDFILSRFGTRKLVQKHIRQLELGRVA